MGPGLSEEWKSNRQGSRTGFWRRTSRTHTGHTRGSTGPSPASPTIQSRQRRAHPTAFHASPCPSRLRRHASHCPSRRRRHASRYYPSRHRRASPRLLQNLAHPLAYRHHLWTHHRAALRRDRSSREGPPARGGQRRRSSSSLVPPWRPSRWGANANRPPGNVHIMHPVAVQQKAGGRSARVSLERRPTGQLSAQGGWAPAK
jgi:hypothetical protein